MTKPDLTVRNIGSFSLEGFQGVDPLPTLEKVIGLLRGLKVFFHVSAGTALGIYRDKAFIPHDTDLDLAVVLDWKQDNYETTDIIVQRFARNNLPLVRSLVTGSQTVQLVFIDLGNHQTLIDVEFYYTGILKYRWVHYKEEGYISLPSYYGVKDVDFRGVAVPLPDPIEDYLKKRYGNWQTPTKEKGAWQAYTKALHLWE